MGRNLTQMMLSSVRAAICAAGVWLLVPYSGAHAQGNLVTNGDFETGDLSGWEMVWPIVVAIPTGGGSLAAVFNSADGPPNGLIFQNIPTVPGRYYRVTFDYGVVTYWPASQSIEFFASGPAGGPVSRIVTDPSPSGPVTLERHTFAFQAGGTDVSIGFKDVTSNFTPATDGVIDNVSLVETTSLVVNGDFESGDLSGWVDLYGNVGAVTPFGGGSLAAVFNSSDSPPNGSISQLFPVMTGQNYRLELSYGVLTYWPANQSLWVRVEGNTGTLLMNQLADPSPSGPVTLQHHSFNFQAEGSSAYLQFWDDLGNFTTATDGVLDNVRVVSTDIEWLAGVKEGSVAWGDYDSDGDLDILLTGAEYPTGSLTRIYRNSGGANPTFTDIGAGLPNVSQSSGVWGDYDNDGDLDILLAGTSSGGSFSRIYRNSGGANPTFANISAGLAGVYNLAVAWGDYDNDGDLDILLTGDARSPGPVAAPTARIYRNSGGANPTFTEVSSGLVGVMSSSAAWGDYDNDGDLDILLTGMSAAGRVGRIYRNGGGVNPTFTNIGAGLVVVDNSSVAWGDYDSDGDLDILLAGYTGAQRIARVYRNGGGANPAFTDIGAGLEGVESCSVAWGDYDNDGDLDILLAGVSGASEDIARIYLNSGGANPTFTTLGLVPGFALCSVAWGDYDNDGDLDRVLSGVASSFEGLSTRIYRSTIATANTPPSAPTGLASSFVGDQVTLSWTASADAQTPSAGLSYNLRVGTTPGGNQICSAMAHPTSGSRRVVALGNAQKRTSWTLKRPGMGTEPLYWGVQAIDAAWAGSPFATNVTLDVGETPAVSFRARVAPNPLNRPGVLTFVTTRTGRVQIGLYDTQGREVHRLLDEWTLPSGTHQVAIDDGPSRLRAGLYFYRIAAAEGELRGRFLVVR